MRSVQGLPADLPDAARLYLDALPPGRIVGFSMAPLDRTGVPAWKVALFLDDDTLPGAMPSGYGYGATDGDAIVGALAEIAEAIWPTLAIRAAGNVTASYDALRRERGAAAVVDPLTLCLPAGSPVGRDTPLAWTAAIRARTGETVLVPVDVAACDYFEMPPGYQPFTTLITNGLGAGPDVEWAMAHGLLECLQRDGNGLLFRALDQGIVLDLAGAELEGQTRDLLDRLDGLGIEVMPKFATDEFGLANVYVVGFDRAGHDPAAPIMLSACGEACDPDRDRALGKALLEFCSARVRKTYGHGPIALARTVAPSGYIEDFVGQALASLDWEESRALSAMMDWSRMDAGELRGHLADSVFSRRATRPFAALPQTRLGDTRERGRFARERLEAAGFDVLYVDCSPPGREIGVAKVIVPGLEVETMSYYRIGERNARKLIERESPLVRFGKESDIASGTLRPVRLTPEALDRLGGRTPLLDTDAVDQAVGPLYPLYREPDAHHVGYRMERGAVGLEPA